MPWKSGLQIRVIQGENKGDVTRLLFKRMTVGRTQQKGTRADGWVLLTDKTISRRHLELVWEERLKAFSLHHISMTNLTLLNGEPLEESTLLQEGQQIRVGDSTLLVEADTGGDVTQKPGRTSAAPLANWELTETISAEGIQAALAEVGAGTGLVPQAQPEVPADCFKLAIVEGPEEGREIAVTGEYIVLGRGNTSAAELFRTPNTPEFDQSIEFQDPKVDSNHFLLRWSEMDEGFNIKKNPAAGDVTLGRYLDGNTWLTQLGKNSTPLRPRDTLTIGDTVMRLESPSESF